MRVMSRIFVLLGCVALFTSCCIAKTGKKDELKCLLWQDGKATELAAADSLAAIALSLLASADDELRLLVTPELTQGILDHDTALEVVFPSLITADTAFGVKHQIRRLLIPLSGEYGPPEDLASAIIFFGDDGWITGPNQNNFARPELLKMLELLSG